jgi:hypothetical protein
MNYDTANRYGVYFWGEETVLKLIVVTAAQFCENTNKLWIVHFKWVKCVERESYLNKAIVKNKSCFEQSCLQNKVLHFVIILPVISPIIVRKQPHLGNGFVGDSSSETPFPPCLFSSAL